MTVGAACPVNSSTGPACLPTDYGHRLKLYTTTSCNAGEAYALTCMRYGPQEMYEVGGVQCSQNSKRGVFRLHRKRPHDLDLYFEYCSNETCAECGGAARFGTDRNNNGNNGCDRYVEGNSNNNGNCGCHRFIEGNNNNNGNYGCHRFIEGNSNNNGNNGCDRFIEGNSNNNGNNGCDRFIEGNSNNNGNCGCHRFIEGNSNNNGNCGCHRFIEGNSNNNGNNGCDRFIEGNSNNNGNCGCDRFIEGNSNNNGNCGCDRFIEGNSNNNGNCGCHRFIEGNNNNNGNCGCHRFIEGNSNNNGNNGCDRYVEGNSNNNGNNGYDRCIEGNSNNNGNCGCDRCIEGNSNNNGNNGYDRCIEGNSNNSGNGGCDRCIEGNSNNSGNCGCDRCIEGNSNNSGNSGCDRCIEGNSNNSGTVDYNHSREAYGKTPLTVLKSDGNKWTLVPCATLDANANKPGEVSTFENCPGTLGMGKGVYLETSHIDFLLCMATSGQSKDQILSRCESALLAADVNNVTESYIIAVKYGLQRVMDALIQLIRDNFILVTQTRQFLELPVDMVELFLSDTFVNVVDELDVFTVALRWIDYNKQERLCQSGRVLNCVRYEKIRPVDIRDHVEPNIHLFNGPCGPEALVNIYRKHALAYSGVPDGGPLGPRAAQEDIVPSATHGRPATAVGRERAAAAGIDKGKKLVGKKSSGKLGADKQPPGSPGGAKGKSKNHNASHQGLSPSSSGAYAGATIHWRNRSTSNCGRTQIVSQSRKTSSDRVVDWSARGYQPTHKKPPGGARAFVRDMSRETERGWRDCSRNSRSVEKGSNRGVLVSSARAPSSRRDVPVQDRRSGSCARARSKYRRPQGRGAWPAHAPVARGTYLDSGRGVPGARRRTQVEEPPGFGYSVIVGPTGLGPERDDILQSLERNIQRNRRTSSKQRKKRDGLCVPNKSTRRDHRRMSR